MRKLVLALSLLTAASDSAVAVHIRPPDPIQKVAEQSVIKKFSVPGVDMSQSDVWKGPPMELALIGAPNAENDIRGQLNTEVRPQVTMHGTEKLWVEILSNGVIAGCKSVTGFRQSAGNVPLKDKTFLINSLVSLSKIDGFHLFVSDPPTEPPCTNPTP